MGKNFRVRVSERRNRCIFTIFYRLLGFQRFYTEAISLLPAGKHHVRVEFAYEGGGLGKGGDIRLFIDGEKVGRGRVEATQPMIFSANETCDVGEESGSPVSEDYIPETSRFNGSINWIQFDQGTDDHDHFISPGERLRVAMARQ